MAIHKLNAQKVRTAKAGKYEDGSGLRLVVSEALSRRWVLRYTIYGKRREMGLGGYPTVTLAQARDEALEYRRLAKSGVDPIHHRRQENQRIPTFTSCAAMLIRSKRKSWKNRKHGRQWVSTLKTYARPDIGSKPVDQITVDDVLLVLKPIWHTKTETASRVRSRIENVLDYATAKKYRTGPNPAQWRGLLDKLLPSPKSIAKVVHHPALPYADLPAFYSSIAGNNTLSGVALRFTILTAARTGEVVAAQWSEIDMAANIWTIPPERMKAQREHRVPLSNEAMRILLTLPRVNESPYLFASVKDKPLSTMAMLQFMRKQGYGLKGTKSNAVPHGFRSTFRDWASEESGFPREVAEMALAHAIENKVEAAYRRGDLFATRTKMMNQWASFALGSMQDVAFQQKEAISK